MKNSPPTPPDPTAVLDYWLGPEQLTAAAFEPYLERWYASSKDIDADIASRFGALLTSAERGELADWRHQRQGAIALIILLDQFSRNLYRGTPDAFRNDPAALEIARELVAASYYEALPPGWKLLALHPLHHAEDTVAQAQAVQLMRSLDSDCPEDWQAMVSSSLAFFREHAEIISLFGRFPHRNRILGRHSTPDELAFLEKDRRTYGQ